MQGHFDFWGDYIFLIRISSTSVHHLKPFYFPSYPQFIIWIDYYVPPFKHFFLAIEKSWTRTRRRWRNGWKKMILFLLIHLIQLLIGWRKWKAENSFFYHFYLLFSSYTLRGQKLMELNNHHDTMGDIKKKENTIFYIFLYLNINSHWDKEIWLLWFNHYLS